jgi:hypothetical protein
MLRLRYIVAYMLWATFAAGSYVIADVVRQAIFAFTIVITRANPYVVRFLDRVGFVLIGLVWLALVVFMESVFRHGVPGRTLSLNAANTLCGMAAVLMLAQQMYLQYAPNAHTSLNVTIRDTAVLVLLIGIVCEVFLRRLRKQATP